MHIYLKTMSYFLLPIIWFLFAALLAGGAALSTQAAYTAWQDAMNRIRYEYKYFGPRMMVDLENQKTTREFLNRMDNSKRKADKYLKAEFGDSDQLAKAREVNDYTFRVLRDFWFVQTGWYERNGRYFQGKVTTEKIPLLGKTGHVEYGFGLTDQIENWSDIGYVDQFAPVSIRSDVYSGPKGDGYIVTVQFRSKSKIFQMRMHEGPEDKKIESLVWESEQLEDGNRSVSSTTKTILKALIPS